MLAVLALPALAESQAYFPGGNNALIAFLMREMRYPADAAENGIEGKVLVKFTVTPTGEIKNPEIVRPVDPSLEQEAIRVVLAMPAWVPATDDSGKMWRLQCLCR